MSYHCAQKIGDPIVLYGFRDDLGRNKKIQKEPNREKHLILVFGPHPGSSGLDEEEENDIRALLELMKG